jgi:hypothetical protein
LLSRRGQVAAVVAVVAAAAVLVAATSAAAVSEAVTLPVAALAAADSAAAAFGRRLVFMVAAHTSPVAALADLAGHRIPTMAVRACLLQIRADPQQQSADQRVRGRPESRLQIANQIAQAHQ